MKIMYAGLLVALLLATATANATPIDWRRAAGLDVASGGNAVNLGVIDEGTWTVNGSIRLFAAPGGSHRVDAELFTFAISPSAQITSAWVTWDDPNVGLYSGSMNWLTLLSSAGGVFTAAAPHDINFVPPGRPSVAAFHSDGGDGLYGSPYSFTYTIHLNVAEAPVAAAPAAVPEPSMLALLSVGLLLAGIQLSARGHAPNGDAGHRESMSSEL